MNAARDSGEVVLVQGHQNCDNTGVSKTCFTDNQRVQFHDTLGCGSYPHNTPIVEAQQIFDYSEPLTPGIWVLNGSNVLGYTYLFDSSLTSQMSFVRALGSKGVLAVAGTFVHARGDSVEANDTMMLTKEIMEGRPLGKALKTMANVYHTEWDESTGYSFKLGVSVIGDPLISLPPVSSSCVDAPVIIAGKGDSGVGKSGPPAKGQGIPVVRGFRADALPLTGKLDFLPFTVNDLYGNEVTAGNFEGSPDLRDEIFVAHGNLPGGVSSGNDSTIKGFRTDGAEFVAPFFAFGSPHVGGGVTLARAHLGDLTGSTIWWSDGVRLRHSRPPCDSLSTNRAAWCWP